MDALETFKEYFTTVGRKALDRVIEAYPKKKSVEVDYRSLEKFDYELAQQLLEDPTATLEKAEKAIEELNIELPSGEIFRAHVRVYNIPDRNLMIEDISSEMLNKLISFKALVSRRGDVMHKTKVLFLRCSVCGETFRIPMVGNKVSVPQKCPVCKKGKLVKEIEKSTFVDFQMAEAQDLLERVRPGTPAAKIYLYFEDDLVNTIIPGDNVVVTGILRINPEKKQKANVYTRYVEVVHVKKLKRDFEEIDISREDEKEILKLAALPDIEERIVKSIAYDIYGYEEVKRAIALQLFGGTKGKKTPAGAPIRDDIHLLLVGDPGIAKTRFLQHVVRLAPKSIYVSGKSVTGVGLTASAERDELSGGGWTLKAGALVLASGGIAAIDEFDKIDEEDRAALHEVMESQTVSIAKAGIVARFRAKTAIIAAANPKFGRFLPNRNIAEQFNIPPSLLSRFDLIFPIMDVLDLKKDENLAEHILNMHITAGEMLKDESIRHKVAESIIEPELLRKYIAYARKHVRPILSREAAELIKEFYVKLRSLGQKTGTVPITPRYLEGLVRLAEANAKMRLSDVVEGRDAKVAIHLMQYVMDQVMRDKETGLYDVDTINVGVPRKTQEKMDGLRQILEELAEVYNNRIDIQEVISEAKERMGMSEREVMKILEKLEEANIIFRPNRATQPNIISLVRYE